jgi:hypothetical protein
MCAVLWWWWCSMPKTRIEVYINPDNFFLLERLRKEWERKNYSQVINHMITNYYSLLREMNVGIAKKKAEKQTNELKKNPLMNTEEWFNEWEKKRDTNK